MQHYGAPNYFLLPTFFSDTNFFSDTQWAVFIFRHQLFFSDTLLIDQLSPNSLGKLIALYEHKLFVQGVIWNIFSYDQWGVQLGKVLAKNTLNDIQSGKVSEGHDVSTQALLNKLAE